MKILIFTLLTIEISVAQLLTEQTSKNSNCFGGVLKGNCSDPNDRAFVKLISAGVKYSDRYNATLCTPYWTATIPPECCVQEPNDCYGEYSVVANNSYNYHKDCIGKNKCSQRLAAQMDILYLTSCDHNLYPSQTTYMDVELYCINVNNITPLNNGNKQNNGQGSTLYFWSGDSSTYSELTVATHTCSVETDCDGEISVLSLDFRFADDNMNLTCIDDNVLTVTDGSRTDNFTCSSNNNFQIKTLYTSSNNYITITYTGTAAGGYLWLGFQTSTNGNLTINCQSPGQIYTCETSTTEEPTTTEQETTRQQTTTPEATTSLQSTTNETTTGSLTSTEDQTFTTDNSSTTTDKETSGKSESPSSGNNTAMIAGIAAAIIIIILLVIAGFVYKKIIKPWREELKKKKEQHQSDTSPNSNTNVIKQGNGLPAIQSTRDNVSSGSTRSLLTMENSIQPMENNTVPKETKSESSKDLIGNEQDNNVKQITSIKNMEHSEPVPVELSKNTSRKQLAPLTPQLIQDEEKRKKKKKKKKHMKNKVEDIDNELQANGFSASAGNEAVIENINENGEHSKKHKKKKKKTKTKTHENASEVNGQENSGDTHERKEKKKKKKKRKERESEDFKQEEENTTIITQTIEEENDT